VIVGVLDAETATDIALVDVVDDYCRFVAG
jgi:hypothetical protein